MLVCLCKAVTDRAIRQAVQDGAQSRGAVSRDCGAGNGCGGCTPVIDEILAAERRFESKSVLRLVKRAATGERQTQLGRRHRRAHLAERHADLLLTQWPHLSKRDGAKFRGSVV